MLHYLSTATVPLSEVGTIAWFTAAQFVVFIAVGWMLGAALRLPGSTRPIIGLAAAFANSGNYGLPLVQLAFGDQYILHQAVIVSLHSILITSLGVVLISHREQGAVGSLAAAFRTPMIPAVGAGLLIAAFDWRLPGPVATPLQILGSAYTPVALFALGAQLAASRWQASFRALGLGLAVKLLVAPLATWAAVLLLGIHEDIGDLLIVVASAPVGVLLAIICAEYRAHPDLASATVFFSTLLSPLVVTAAIYGTRVW